MPRRLQRTARDRARALSLVSALTIGALLTPVHGERLATRKYNTADGLAGDYVLGISRDSRGFLWFSTRDGVSRFDGVRFVNYGMARGLPTATINAVLETRDGRVWVATNGGGVALFDPRSGKKLFTAFPVGGTPTSNRVNVLYEDRAGQLWAGTDEGLFRREDDRGQITFRRYALPLEAPRAGLEGIGSIAEDAEGSLWISGSPGLLRLLPDKRLVIYRPEPGRTLDAATALGFDREGRLWIGFISGLYVHHAAPAASFNEEPEPIERVLLRRPAAPDRWYLRADGLPDSLVTTLLVDREDGGVWVGTPRGLGFVDRAGVARTVGARQGVAENHITRLADDQSGSLWIGSVNGATRLVRHGLVTYDVMDGLANARVHSLAIDRANRLVVMSGEFYMSQFDGERFASVRPAGWPQASCSWMARCGMLDREGDWWISGPTDLHRWILPRSVAEIAQRPADERYPASTGLPKDSAFITFEDRSGNVWVGTNLGGVAKWTRTTNVWRIYGETDGLPPLGRMYGRLTAFSEDRAGTPWLGFDGAGLVRLRSGRFERFSVDQGAPAGYITALHLDRAGRFWIASTEGGLAQVENPQAERPSFRPFTTANGLSSDNVRCIVEDDAGRLYAGTTRGVDRLDPESGVLKHFSISEGLASDFVTSAVRDTQGRLWFGTISGLSRLDVVNDRAPAESPPAAFIGNLSIAGAAQPVSELGETEPASLTLAPDQNQVEIGFFGFSFEAGAPLRYQYRLDPVQADWGPATEIRSVNYARLSHGAYRFLVRAVRSDGAVSAVPATVAFTVLPPIYARWWFIGLTLVIASGGAVALYRARVAQLLRVERVRARIATDLHDDIGASLSQIAVLAEVARERLHREATEAASEPMARIAETSRGLVDSMSDIVWAINPEVDSLSDLVHRMRRFVEDTIGASEIDVVFRAPEPSVDLRLGADLRREVFLILKESVTNIVKHAGATRVAIDFESDRRRLWLRVSDDGRGFDPSQATDGNGVASMRRRVAALGGRLAIESAPGRGTTISLDVERRFQ